MKRFASILFGVLLSFAVISMPALQGCKALGLQESRTFSQDYAYALGQTTALRTAATTALQAKQISVADAEYVLKLTDQSRAYLDTAREVYDAGKSLEGQTQLQLATNVLLQLQSFLNARASR